MNRAAWKEIYRTARRGRTSVRFTRGDEWWSVSPRRGVSRLVRGGWQYARPWRADHALALDLSAHMWRRFKLASGGADYARRLRLGQEG